MSKQLLNKFFKENTVKKNIPTAQAIAHFHIELENNPEANEKIQGLFNEEIFKSQPKREEKVLAEKNEIESATTYEQIINFMRRDTDPMNRNVLINKAMEFENDIVPDILKRLKTSLNDGFTETAIRVLAKSGKDIVEELIGYFDDIRNPYAQSMVLVLLGFKTDETHIPWFIKQYDKLKKLYPNETYCEGAYYALYEIENRFYFSGKEQNSK